VGQARQIVIFELAAPEYPGKDAIWTCILEVPFLDSQDRHQHSAGVLRLWVCPPWITGCRIPPSSALRPCRHPARFSPHHSAGGSSIRSSGTVAWEPPSSHAVARRQCADARDWPVCRLWRGTRRQIPARCRVSARDGRRGARLEQSRRGLPPTAAQDQAVMIVHNETPRPAALPIRSKSDATSIAPSIRAADGAPFPLGSLE